MSFAAVLDAYCAVLHYTNKEIADRCGVSPSSLSRYRKGERTPAAGSAVTANLANGIAALYEEQHVQPTITATAILSALESGLRKPRILGMSFGARLNALMDLLDLRNAELALRFGVDPSHISRIRSDQRMPGNLTTFVESCSRLAARRCYDQDKLDDLVQLVDSAGDGVDRSYRDLDNRSDLSEMIADWLMGSNIVVSDTAALESLFEKLDARYFDDVMEEYRNFKQDFAVPSFGKEQTRFFYGVDQMREAENMFFALAAHGKAPFVSMSSDVPMLQMSLAGDAVREYVRNVAMLVAHGCHVNIVHSVERPVHEAVIALEHWIPLYIDGAATPYYLKGVTNRMFCHVNYVCDVCALASEGVMGHQAEGRYYLTTLAEDVAYYKRKMEFILDESVSLLDIYHEDVPAEKRAFDALEASKRALGTGREVLPGRYDNLRIWSYPGDCAVLSVTSEPVMHAVIRHPKIRYVIGHMD